jgi:hypothetical protein
MKRSFYLLAISSILFLVLINFISATTISNSPSSYFNADNLTINGNILSPASVYDDTTTNQYFYVGNPNTVSNPDTTLQITRGQASRGAKILFYTNQTMNWQLGTHYDLGNNFAIRLGNYTSGLTINSSSLDVQINSGSKFCLDGNTCNHYIKYNGTCITNGTICIG